MRTSADGNACICMCTHAHLYPRGRARVGQTEHAVGRVRHEVAHLRRSALDRIKMQLKSNQIPPNTQNKVNVYINSCIRLFSTRDTGPGVHRGDAGGGGGG